jgi:hypothetical protein
MKNNNLTSYFEKEIYVMKNYIIDFMHDNKEFMIVEDGFNLGLLYSMFDRYVETMRLKTRGVQSEVLDLIDEEYNKVLDMYPGLIDYITQKYDCHVLEMKLTDTGEYEKLQSLKMNSKGFSIN